MKITKQVKATGFKKVTVGFKCDICKKQHDGEDYPDSWHYFSHSHNGWGNDSIDSYEYFLVCSPECYFKQLIESLKDVGGYYDSKIDDKGKDFVINLLEFVKPLMLKT